MLKFLGSDLMLRVQELYLHFLNVEDKKLVHQILERMFQFVVFHCCLNSEYC